MRSNPIWRHIRKRKYKIVSELQKKRALRNIINLGFTLTRELKPNRCFLIERGGKSFLLKRVTDEGLIFHRDVQPHLDLGSSNLLVPVLEEICHTDSSGTWLLLHWLRGTDNSLQWSALDPETAGGRASDTDMIAPLLDALEELRCLNIENIEPIHRLKRKLEDSPVLSEEYRKQSRKNGWLSAADWNSILKNVDTFRGNAHPLMLSNGDFHCGNTIQVPDGRLALIDWDGARVSTSELERCIAKQWLLMWDNELWMDTFLRLARSKFSLETSALRTHIVLRSLSFARLWRKQSSIREHFFSIARKFASETETNIFELMQCSAGERETENMFPGAV